MKLHVGNGSVYLGGGWLNIDIPGPSTFLAANRPDLVEKWITEESDYYGKHKDVSIQSLRKGPRDQETVCDRYGSFAFLPLNEPIDEALTRHAFEHLSLTEARQALCLLHQAMRSGGILRIDVPDHAKTLRLFKETGDAFYVRHLLGPRRGDDRGHHVMSYEPRQLRALVEEHGFRFVADEGNIHVFPAFTLRFERI